MHSMQAGYLEKAQKYTDKALMQLEKLKSKCIYASVRFESIKREQIVFISVCLLHCSVGLQPHPLHLSSHSAGAHHHV